MPWYNFWSSGKQEKNENTRTPAGRVEDAARDAAKTVEQGTHTVVANASWLTVSSTRAALAEPQTILAATVLMTACFGCFRFYKTYLQRIPQAPNIHQSYFRKRSLFGKVTSVGDGDNFRIYHTPGGWLAGWGWLPWRRVPTDRKLLKNNTIHVRLAGIDAPELSHFGRPAQPYSREALIWLTEYLRGRRVRAYVYKADHYGRVVATAYVWKGIFNRDVGLQMLRAGMATVYEAKTGAEFGVGREPIYREAEQQAKHKRKGMWGGDQANHESPREYKNKYRGQDQIKHS